MQNDDKKIDLTKYRVFGRFTVLQITSLVAILGIVLALVAHWILH